MTFDAVSEPQPGPKWAARWARSWPAYKAWFHARGGESGPSRAECEAALAEHMPELVPLHRRLTRRAGGDDLAARFLSTWCPPPYLGGCSMAARAVGGSVRLVRNYDLSPDLNEGLLLRSAWTGTPVMGMVEFLWGLSDGINAAGLSAALAFGGRGEVGCGFGVTTILRYVLETCDTVDQAIAVLRRVPSHMAYNITLADRRGRIATIELLPGGGAEQTQLAIATNHQHGGAPADRPAFTRTHERLVHLERLLSQGISCEALGDAFLARPLYQTNYAEGFGTLFTAVYDPAAGSLALRWPNQDWVQRLNAFTEGQRRILLLQRDRAPAVPADTEVADPLATLESARAFLPPAVMVSFDRWIAKARNGSPDWAGLGSVFAQAGSQESRGGSRPDGRT